VATDAAISWKTGFWFWMGGLSGGGTTPHQAITGGQGLGGTIRIINGIECAGNPGNPAAIQNRIRHFKRFSYMFGFDPGALASGC
jgi:chitinase